LRLLPIRNIRVRSLERANIDAAGRSLGLTIDCFGTKTSDELKEVIANMANQLPEAISADGLTEGDLAGAWSRLAAV
jgi:hypothetical protein